MFQTNVVEKTKQTFYAQYIFSSENRTVYEIMWKNVEGAERPQMRIWRMLIGFCMPKTTHTHTHTHTNTLTYKHTQTQHTHTDPHKHTHTQTHKQKPYTLHKHTHTQTQNI